MSSTSRGGERLDDDFYATPAWCVHRLLDRVMFIQGRWLEPAAGDGAIIRAVGEHDRASAGLSWAAVDIRPNVRADLVDIPGLDAPDIFPGTDFLAGDFGGCEFDAIITNPPFSLAMEFIRQSLPLAPTVAMLLRLNFLGSLERSSFFSHEMPDLYVLPNRPSFAQSVSCSKKKSGCDYKEMLALTVEAPKHCPKCGAKTKVSTSDSIEYAWFVWTADRGRRIGTVEILDQTSSDSRRAR